MKKEAKVKKDAAKAETKKTDKTKSTKKEKANRDSFGSAIGSGRNLINEALSKGGTIPEIVERSKQRRSFVRVHIKHLIEKGHKISEKNGVYKLQSK